MSVKTQLRGVYETLLSIDHRHFDRLFALLLLAFIGIMLVDTSEYSDDGQLFPLVIGIPTFLLLVLLLALQVSSRLNALATRYTASDLFEVDDVMDELDEDVDEGSVQTGHDSLQEERTNVILISLWTLALFGIIVLVGFLPGTLIFLLVYYRFQADQSWLYTLAYSLIMWLFVIVIFEVVLGTPFYTGVLDVELPLPT